MKYIVYKDKYNNLKKKPRIKLKNTLNNNYK